LDQSRAHSYQRAHAMDMKRKSKTETGGDVEEGEAVKRVPAP
jgi:hypothetical protein